MERIIEINWTKEDAIKFNRLYGEEINGGCFSTGLLYFSLILSFQFVFRFIRDTFFFFLLITILIVITLTLCIYDYKRKKKERLEKERIIVANQQFGKKSYFFSDDYISEGTTENEEERIAWTELYRVIEMKEFLALELEDKSLIVFPLSQLGKWDLNFLKERIRVKNVHVWMLDK